MTELSPPLSVDPAVSPDVMGFGALSSEMLAGVLDQSLDCIKLIGPDGRLSFMNVNGLCAMQIDDFRQVANRHWWELWPEQSRAKVRHAVELASRGSNQRFEAFCPTAKGAPRWWDVSVSPLRDERGEIAGLISISRDVTERVARHELSETAAAEMRHRLQNAYALVGAMINSAVRDTPELKAAADNLLERIARLGAAQRLLLEVGHEGDVPLSALLEKLLEPFGKEEGGVRVASIPDLLLREEDVRTLALVLGELSTNSNKYGALGFGGTVLLSGEIAGNDLVLRWEETNAWPPDGKSNASAVGSGSGHRLVTRALGARGGTFTPEWRPEGLSVRVTLPIDR